MTEYYKVLGIPQTEDKKVIKRAYRSLAMQCHPDIPGGDNDKFIEVKLAYEALMKAPLSPYNAHTQYQPGSHPYAHVNSIIIDKWGDAVIDMSIRHIGVIQMEGSLGMDYHWLTFGQMYAILVIRKKDLIKCGYKCTLRFHPVVGSSVTREFTFGTPRTKLERLMDKLKSYL